MSRRDVLKLLRAARGAARHFLIAVFESIARPREIRSLRWGDLAGGFGRCFAIEDVSKSESYFKLTMFKSQSARSDGAVIRNIPINARLGRLLIRLYGSGRPADELIFKNSRGRPWSSNAVRCAVRRARAKAGLAPDVNGEKVVAYTLRHTGATGLVAAGVKTFIVAEWLGHSDIRMTQRYVHLQPAELLKASNEVEAFKRGCKRKNGRPG